jgi:hypothetical protein
MKDNKILVFDMDGTIADFYGVNGWLDYLQNEDTTPYTQASPLYDMNVLNMILEALKRKGWNIIITTWLAKNGSQEFNDRTREAKKAWLDSYNFPYDDLHMVKYGTTKANCTRKLGGFQILVDDNEKVRKGWTLGATIDANNNILDSLLKILMSA